MIEGRVKKLENTVAELDARCLMHDVMIAHLLGNIGSTTSDMRGFTQSLLYSVGVDLKENGMRALGTPDAQRFADALKVLEYFSDSMMGSIDKAPKEELN